MSLFLFPSSPFNFSSSSPFSMFSFSFLRSSPLPSNSLRNRLPQLSLSFLPPYLSLTPCRDPPKKFSQTPTHARITLPRPSPPWYVCGRDVRVVGSYRRRGKHLVSSLIPTIQDASFLQHFPLQQQQTELFSITKS